MTKQEMINKIYLSIRGRKKNFTTQEIASSSDIPEKLVGVLLLSMSKYTSEKSEHSLAPFFGEFTPVKQLSENVFCWVDPADVLKARANQGKKEREIMSEPIKKKNAAPKQLGEDTAPVKKKKVVVAPEEDDTPAPVKKKKIVKGLKPGKEKATEETPVKKKKVVAEPTPEPVKKSKKTEPVKKPKKEAGQPSNKEIIYKAWMKSKKKATTDELLQLVDGAVKEGTVKGWVSSWNRGQGLPACVKTA